MFTALYYLSGITCIGLFLWAMHPAALLVFVVALIAEAVRQWVKISSPPAP